MAGKNIHNPRTHEAGEWFALMRGPRVSIEDKKAFDAWLGDSANRAEFEAMQEVWQTYGEAGDEPEITEIKCMLGGNRGRTSYLGGRRAGSFAVAAAAVIVLCIAAAQFVFGGNTYTTGVGEQRHVEFSDGSTILMNTSAEIGVDYTNKFRRIELRKGQALFTVAADPLRPFVVVAGDTLVRAVGTEFDVYRQPNDVVTVAVSEGVVQVTRTVLKGAAPFQRRLGKGEIATVVAKASQIEVGQLDPELVSSWRDGTLDFEGVALADALAEINRYTDKNFTIGDQRLNDLLVSAVLRISDRSHFADILETTFPVVVMPDEEGNLVLMMRESS